MHSAADGPRSAADVCWLSGAFPQLQQACRCSCPKIPCNAGGLGDLKPSGVITSSNFGQFAGAVHLFGQPDCGTKLQAESKSYAKLIQDQLIGTPNPSSAGTPSPAHHHKTATDTDNLLAVEPAGTQRWCLGELLSQLLSSNSTGTEPASGIHGSPPLTRRKPPLLSADHQHCRAGVVQESFLFITDIASSPLADPGIAL